MVRLPPPSSWSAALIAAFVGFGGTIALVVQALRAMGATVDQTGSAVTALCLGIAIAGAALSIRYRMPVVLAWSTPGAALLAATTAGLSWPVAIALFGAAALMMIVVGVTPALGRLIARIPAPIASAMLAGVLLPFCLTLFRLSATDPVLIAALLVIFLAARRRLPRFALIFVLVAAVGFTLVRGDMAPLATGRTFGTLLPTLPAPDLAAVVSLALPLFMVTLVSQNLPGLVVLQSAGYRPPAGALITTTGVASLIGAPFGAHGVNLAAITAAICTGPDAHPDPGQRWQVGVLYAGFYLALAGFAPTLVRFFLALPPEVIASVTGLALIPALIGAVENMMADSHDRDPAIVTFLATGSGLVLWGLGSAFWGLVAGFVALGLKRILERPAPRQAG
ncbi:benzoate/H(+) symporter BenE family transporter [Phenylobacterium sp.]|uniref:benzoate/H(+) symporter BenE family transporter n=1 Tax=Phenylobacterium sp. TaxID=1871053 RepID=UPI00272F6142|nr:benzoate/H(+) symporter BenE family transporter [Phenylobacterium sp.]MDP1619227.1 benzoate/H(+) symporter BenE family transporter [Phenylobacterium sp.]MDP1986445.1 benzoate/H(+) symporter BenE family transporter [Phenylobacterium sp.]